MVRAWIADVTPLYDKDCYKYYYRQLPDFRKQKADALRHMETKAQSAGVWILWEKIQAYYDLPGSSVFNFSHSGRYVMCAAAIDRTDVKVGCDVEKTGEFREKAARRFFCQEEYEEIMKGHTEKERTDRFYRYWVLKESFIKATGRGMGLPLSSFCIKLGSPSMLIRKPEEYPEHYYYTEFEIKDMPYRFAVCSTDDKMDTELHMELKL